MPIPRLHLFELEDQSWFPAAVRDLATDYLHYMETRFAMHRPAVALLAEGLREAGADRVVDLCSGGGGSIPCLQRELADAGQPVTCTLTDLFPNREAYRRLTDPNEGRIEFSPLPIDARKVPPERRLPWRRRRARAFLLRLGSCARLMAEPRRTYPEAS